MRLSNVVRTCLASLLCTGCSFFPRHITPPESVFSDKELGTRRVVTQNPFEIALADAASKKESLLPLQADAIRLDQNQRVLQLTAEIASLDRQIASLKTVIDEQKKAGGVTTTQAPLFSSRDPGVLAAGFEFDLLSAAQKMGTPATSSQAKEYLEAGITLVNHRCGEYFQNLGVAAQKQSFASKELALTTGVTAAIQGLTSVAAKDIAITAGMLGFLGSSSAAYSDVYLFSPDVAGVSLLVQKAQAAVIQ